jgi:hypothetical protein
MPIIKLTKGKESVVSEEDFEYLNQWRWCTHSYNYGMRNITLKGGKSQATYIHRLVMERILGHPIPEGMQIDHINGNGLDNRRENLRLATRQQNRMNSRKYRRGDARYKGVLQPKGRGSWIAQIRLNRKNIRIGLFATEEEAARAYDAKARELFGEFARLNFPDE